MLVRHPQGVRFSPPSFFLALGWVGCPPGQRKDLGAFRTKVFSRRVDPRLCCYDKFSRLKQYFNEQRPNLT